MPPLLTNELLEKLTNSLDAFGSATARLANLDIPTSANIPFYRMGEPIRIPVSPDSGNTPFPLSGTITLPPNVTAFMVTNLNPFPVRLKGTRMLSSGEPQAFQPVTATTGWVFMPGMTGPFTTLKPVQMAAMSVDGPFASTDPSQKAGSGWIELQYGVV